MVHSPIRLDATCALQATANPDRPHLVERSETGYYFYLLLRYKFSLANRLLERI